MLDLTSKSSEFAYTWVTQHIKEKPADSGELTWFVGAGVLYRDYTREAMAAVPNESPLSFNELYGVLKIAYPRLVDSRYEARVPVFLNIKYLRDGVQVFGV